VRFLIVLAIAAGAGYYAYQAMSGGGGAPSCMGAETACMQKCRNTTTETQAAQACQDACRRDAEACEREKARAQ
jgi:hypothetical protein